MVAWAVGLRDLGVEDAEGSQWSHCYIYSSVSEGLHGSCKDGSHDTDNYGQEMMVMMMMMRMSAMVIGTGQRSSLLDSFSQ